MKITKIQYGFLITLCVFAGCDDTKENVIESCIVCRSDVAATEAPYIDCADNSIEAYATYCESSTDTPPQCESVATCCNRAPLGSEGCPVSAPEMSDIDITNNQSLSAVPGEIIFTGIYEGDTHIFSLDRVNEEIYQISEVAGAYQAVSIGVDRRYILYSKTESTGNSVVWLYDMQNKSVRNMSPLECDAGKSGLGWFNDSFIGFAMKCPGDTYSQAYLGNVYDEVNRNALRQLTAHEADVVEVYPILNTTFFLYARIDLSL